MALHRFPNKATGFLIAVFLLLTWSASARVVDRIVAFVNDDIVTMHELEGRIEERALELQQVYRFSPAEADERARQEQDKLLDQMVRERLLYQHAQVLQLEVSESEVDQYVATFKDNAGLESDEQLRQELARRDLSLESFREQARQNLMAQGLVWQEILPKLSVTDTEIDRFFAENRSQFPTKLDEVTLRHIFLTYQPTQENIDQAHTSAIQVLEEVQQPDADFGELAKKHSQNPQTRERDGRMDLLPAQFASFPEEFQNAVNALEPGQIGEPIKTENGFHIVRLEDRTAELIQLSHIFLPIVPGEEAKDAAQERVATARTRLEAGDDFATVATEMSEDIESKDMGGELGTRNLSEFPPEIQSVLGAMTPGEFSTPIPTAYGVHIFLLQNRQPASLTVEEREQVRALLRQQKFEAKWHEYTDDLKARAFVKLAAS